MSTETDLAEFVHAWVADQDAKRRREDRLRQIIHEIAWAEREIERVEAEALRRPSKRRHVAQLRHQLRHKEIEYAIEDADMAVVPF